MDFELLISQDGPCFVYITLSDVSYCPECSIFEFYDDVRGSLCNWRHCKQQFELAAMLVCRRI